MRTYDPADRILYVHLAQDPAVPAVSQRAQDECHRLPAGYANESLRARVDQPRTATARHALVLLPGGAAPAECPPSAAPALRLAR
jgi:hypothetical protein